MYNKLFSCFIVVLILLLFTVQVIGVDRVDQIGKGEDRNVITLDFTYNVQPGDSLYKLSRRFGTTIDRIKNINNLITDIIYIGQKLVIPTAEKEKSVIYIVKPGDSLYKISRSYGITVNEIKVANNLRSDLILVGQRLIVPTTSQNYGSISGRVSISNKSARVNSTQSEFKEMKQVKLLTIDDLTPVYKESEVIIKFKPMISSQAIEQMEKTSSLVSLNMLETDEGKIVHYKIPEGKKVEELVKHYNGLANVEWAEPNYYYYPTSIPTDSYYDYYQWNLINLNLEAAWDLEKGDQSVIVAVLDTGVITDHPDLKDHLLLGADFVGGQKSYPVENYTITDSDPTDETTRNEGGSHGTHVAGIIGAITNNYRGVAGINWNVKILPVRVLEKKGGTSWDIAEGIYYAIDQGASIINLSLGSRYESYLQKEAVQSAYDKGVTIIAATGNEGGDVYYPAAYKETIAVGAVNRDNTITYYSNYGPEVDVVAPGGGSGGSVFSTWGYVDDQGKTTPGYVGMVGTSMATPHVSGVAALLVASGINDPEKIRSRLANTAVDLGVDGKDNKYGYGLVDAYSALLGSRLERPRVFAAVKDGNTLYLKSEIENAGEDGFYSLKVTQGEVYVVCWLDSNKNNLIDKGDYYGETKQPVSVKEGRIENINLTGFYTSNIVRKLRY